MLAFTRKSCPAVVAGVVVATFVVGVTPASAAPHDSFIGSLPHNTTVASTIPRNGDVNPYGVAIVPVSRGKLVAGDILVSNFNNAPTATASGGEQGRGSTLVEISPAGKLTQFAHISAAMVPGGVGLTTALVVLRSGWVIVGSLPTSDGTAATARPGELIVLDATGTVRETIAGRDISGPWDATALDLGRFAELFVSNVMTGITSGQPAMTHNGNVVRLILDLRNGPPRVLLRTVIGAGMAVHTDPAALIVGPTGLALGPEGTLFVADTVNSRIARIPDAIFRLTAVDAGSARFTVSADPRLKGPLGLTLAPNGHLVTVNGGDNNALELTRAGTVVTVRNLDTVDPPGGALFGLAPTPRALYYVNDDNNTLNVLH